MRHLKLFVASRKPLTYDERGRVVYVCCSAYSRALAANHWEEAVEAFRQENNLEVHVSNRLAKMFARPIDWMVASHVGVDTLDVPVWDQVWVSPYEALLIYSEEERWS